MSKEKANGRGGGGGGEGGKRKSTDQQHWVISQQKAFRDREKERERESCMAKQIQCCQATKTLCRSPIKTAEGCGMDQTTKGRKGERRLGREGKERGRNIQNCL